MDDENKELYYDEYEIDLREYLLLLWNKKWLITAFFVVAVVGAWLISTFFLAPVYEAESLLYVPDLTLLNGDKLEKNDYLSYFTNPDIEEDIINKFSLRDKNPDYSPNALEKK